MHYGLAQTETKHRLVQAHLSGFRLVALMCTGTALTSASAVCLVVARLTLLMCLTLAQVFTLIAMVCAQSCRFLNSLIFQMEKLELG